ncbi:unnamed protein product [Laminaria digitata]
MGHGGAAPSAFMPRNSSVEDFLSLVESGDIPPPEGPAGFTVPTWIYSNDGGNATTSGNSTSERPPPKSASKPKTKGSSGSSSSRLSSGISGISEQPRSKRLKTAQAKTEAKG